MKKIKHLVIGLLGRHIKSNMEDMQTYQDNKEECSILYSFIAKLDDIIMRIWTKAILPIYFKLAGK